MNTATAKAIKAILATDETVTPDQCETALALLRGRSSQRAPLPLLLTQKQAADLLGVSRFTVRNLKLAGQLHPVRLLGSWRYRRDEIEAIAAAREA
jgi:hypothetical protein